MRSRRLSRAFLALGYVLIVFYASVYPWLRHRSARCGGSSAVHAGENEASAVRSWLDCAVGSSGSGSSVLPAMFLPGAEAANFTVGAMVPCSGWAVCDQIRAAVPLAVDRINNDSTLLANHTLRWLWEDDACSALPATKALLRLKEKKADVFIGPSCSAACLPTAVLASAWNLPMISFGCASDALSDKTTYPAFMRTVPGADYTDAVASLVPPSLYYGWTHVVLLYDTSQLFTGTQARAVSQVNAHNALVDRGDFYKDPKLNKRITMTTFQFEVGTSSSKPGSRRALLEQVRATNSRVIWVWTYAADYRDILLTAHDMGMTGEGWAWNSGGLSSWWWYGAAGWMGNDGRDETARLAGQGSVSINLAFPLTDPAYHKLVTDNRAAMKSYFNVTVSESASITPYLSYLYDTVYFYATLLNRTLADGKDPRDGVLMRQLAQNVSYAGLTGSVQVDAQGNRFGDYMLQNWVGSSFVPLMLLHRVPSAPEGSPPRASTVYPNPQGVVGGGVEIIPYDGYEPVFAGGSSTPPKSFVEPVRFDLPPTQRWAVRIVCSLIGLFGLLLFGAVIALRTRTNVAASTWQSLLLVVGGVESILASALLTNEVPYTIAQCTAMFNTLHLGFAAVLTPLFVRNVRIVRLFAQDRIVVRRLRWTSNRSLFVQVVVSMVGWGALLLAHNLTASTTLVLVKTQDESRSEHVVCSSSVENASVLLQVIYLLEGIMLVGAAVLALMINRRVIFKRFNDSRSIAVSVYSIVFALLAVVMVRRLRNDRPDVYVPVFTWSTIVAATTVLVVSVWTRVAMDIGWMSSTIIPLSEGRAALGASSSFDRVDSYRLNSAPKSSESKPKGRRMNGNLLNDRLGDKYPVPPLPEQQPNGNRRSSSECNKPRSLGAADRSGSESNASDVVAMINRHRKVGSPRIRGQPSRKPSVGRVRPKGDALGSPVAAVRSPIGVVSRRFFRPQRPSSPKPLPEPSNDPEEIRRMIERATTSTRSSRARPNGSNGQLLPHQADSVTTTTTAVVQQQQPSRNVGMKRVSASATPPSNNAASSHRVSIVRGASLQNVPQLVPEQ